MSKKRRKYSYEEKAIILKRHLVEQEALSDLYDETGCHPSMFYRWQRALFEHPLWRCRVDEIVNGDVIRNGYVNSNLN